MTRREHLGYVLAEVASEIRVEAPESAHDDDYYGDRIFRRLEENGFAIVRPSTPWSDS